MYGQITKFHRALGAGIILADDGRKYRFVKSDILSAGDSLIGQDVDFLISGRRSTQIVMLSASPWTAFSGTRRA